MSEKRPPELPRDAPQDPTISYVPTNLRLPEGEADTSACLMTWATTARRPSDDGEEPAQATPDPVAPSYNLHRVLGRGGMGEVWEATQTSLGRLVAVKRAITGHDIDDRARIRVFQHEAIIAGRLEHPNIVPVHDLGLGADGMPLLAMKLVKGEPWDRTLLDDFANLSAEDLLAKNLPTLIAVGHAVAFAHSQGIVHRDIKPGQVMTGEFGEALLMDWGLAIQVSDPPPDLAKTSVQHVVATLQTASNPAGTIAMMAPEQTSQSAAGIGPWTDVYLLGGTLYYLLTGTFPHAAPTALVAFTKASDGYIEDPRKRAPNRGMPDELVDLCLAALQKEPSNRTPSARAFVDGLKDYLGGSSRRRESRAMVEKASALLEQRPKKYAEFTRIEELVDRALSLWPENPLAPLMLDKVNAAHAQAAINNGDLVLGRSIAERIQSDVKRNTLLAEADRLEALALAQARQRKMLVATSFALLLVIVIGGTIFALKLDEQRLLAQANARDATQRALEAKESRAQADDLVRFMISDLSRKLAPLDKDLRVLDEAAIRAADFYTTQSMYPERLDAKERFNTVNSLEAVAGVLARQGEATRAREIAKRSMEFAKNLEGPTAGPIYAGTIVNYGQELRRAGELIEAGEVFDQAAAVAEPMISSGGAVAYARAVLCRADLYLVGGNVEAGTAHTLRGMEILDRVLAAQPDDPDTVTLYNWGASKLVTAYALAGDKVNALATLGKIRAHGEALMEKRPESVGAPSDIANAWIRESTIHQNSGDLELALAATQQAIRISDKALLLRPTDVSLQSTLAYAVTRNGSILTDMGRHEEAVVDLKRGLELREQLRTDDPGNRELIVRARGSWQRLAEAYDAVGDLTNGLAARTGAVGAGRALYEVDPGPTYQLGLAEDLANLATINLKLERAEAARDHAREACDLLASTGRRGASAAATTISAYTTLAGALEALGDPGAALAYEELLAKLGEFPAVANSGEGWLLRSSILVKLDRPDDARAAAQKAADAGLDTPEFREFLRVNGFEVTATPPPKGDQ
jgi:serine/threonine protein kinase